ncbi:MAG: hypothetical protein NZV14_06885 [Bryobacteraceae bacterium]|nr:hypothetical protein [Bryobacteraceae bacterium]MDW8377867.1 hypothetical protein [Bryobacterales bacterium]
MLRVLLWIAAGLAACWAQPAYDRFEIAQDLLTAPADFGFLNHPLTAADRVFVRDGRFHTVGPDLLPNTADDRPIRFFGVNLCFSANFPLPEDAVRIARRLRKLGVNIVRLHHMDTQPDANPANAASLLTTGPYPSFNPHSLERLRRFLTALAAEGIYVNLNLHVGYQFRPQIDGVPVLTPSIPTQSKPLHIFYPRMVELQVEFAQKLLEALALEQDPVLAMVEINNESSLLWHWQAGQLDSLLNGEYEREFATQWRTHLRGQYRSDEELREAWGSSTPDGLNLLTHRWSLETHSPAQASVTFQESEIQVRVLRGGAPLIVKHTGFSLQAGKVYEAEVELRADLAAGQSRNVYIDVKQDLSPWRTAAGRTVAVTREWQRFTLRFQAPFSMENIGRFGISVENVDQPLWIRNWSLKELGARGLNSGESLDTAALVKTTEASTPQRLHDYLEFLAETDRAYLLRMRDAVRQSGNLLVPVTGTQIQFGGLMTLDSHRDLDYYDNHFYIDHYNFPSAAWDPRDWRIRDTSATATNLQNILAMAMARPAGKPYTVSEFNQNWPNSYAAELLPIVAAMASFQDWDGLMHFAYSHTRNWDDGVPSGFDLNGDWTKFVAFGQAAWLYRTGAIAPGETVFEIPVSRALRERATRERYNGGVSTFLNQVLGLPSSLALTRRVALAGQEGPPPPLPPPESRDFSFDPAQRVFRLHSPFAAGVFGQIGDRQVTAGPLRLQLGPAARGFVAALLTPLDGKPLAESRRLLLTLPGQTLRTQPGSSRPQRVVLYPGTTDWFTLEPEPGSSKPSGNRTGGNRPTYMERIECTIWLDTPGQGLQIYPLDGAGRRLPPVLVEGSQARLNAPGEVSAPWYEIVLD